MGTQDVSNIFGTRLAQVRERRGLSVAELADLSGIPRQTITRIERGSIKEPGIYTAARLAKALNANLDFLAGNYDEAGLVATDGILAGEPWHPIGHLACVAQTTQRPQYSIGGPD